MQRKPQLTHKIAAWLIISSLSIAQYCQALPWQTINQQPSTNTKPAIFLANKLLNQLATLPPGTIEIDSLECNQRYCKIKAKSKDNLAKETIKQAKLSQCSITKKQFFYCAYE